MFKYIRRLWCAFRNRNCCKSCSCGAMACEGA